MCSACAASPGEWTPERTLAHYERLAFSLINQFCRTYKIPRQDREDFEQFIRLKMIDPRSIGYRNSSGGMYTIIKNGCREWKDKFLRVHDRELCGEEKDARDQFSDLADGTDFREQFASSADSEKVVAILARLPGPERACLSLYYGIGSAKAFSLYLISRKIGAPEWMIKRYIVRGILLLKRQIGETSLPARIHRHA